MTSVTVDVVLEGICRVVLLPMISLFSILLLLSLNLLTHLQGQNEVIIVPPFTYMHVLSLTLVCDKYKHAFSTLRVKKVMVLNVNNLLLT